MVELLFGMTLKGSLSNRIDELILKEDVSSNFQKRLFFTLLNFYQAVS